MGKNKNFSFGSLRTALQVTLANDHPVVLVEVLLVGVDTEVKPSES